MSKCIHNKIKTLCKDCGGSGLCIHFTKKSMCKSCYGSQICIHNKQKASCIDCGGSQICIHNKRKSRCRECDGKEYCIHNKAKNICIDCKGASICEHNKIKFGCIECKGSQICIHNKRKSRCVECKGSQICIHNREKTDCIDCGGSQICIHNKRKRYCKECLGSQICIHNKRKTKCRECDGSELCKSIFCEKSKIKKYNNYCLTCCINLFPDIKVSRNYKTKELTIVDFIINKFSNLTWISDKKIYDGCSKRRPDLLLDLGEKIIIIEVDENKHNNYDCICENKRLMEISQDLNHRPIIFIRFNPDKYTDINNNQITSCWKINPQSGVLYINKKKLNE